MFTLIKISLQMLVKWMPIALPIILGITLEITDEDYEGSNEENLESTKSYPDSHQLRMHPGG